MTHINEDMLNRYIDNELSGKELSDINDHIKSCDSCLNLLKAQKVTDNQLKKLEIFNPSPDFTERIMRKVHSAAQPFKPKKSYFFRFVFSFILLLSLGVVITAFAQLPSDPDQSISINEYLIDGISEFFSGYKNIVTGQSASIVGAVLSFIIFVSAYFIYESHKSFKTRIDKLS